MDPNANITEQREIAQKIIERADREPDENFSINQAIDAGRMAELVLALDAWRKRGGFDPYGGDAQSNALARLMRDRPDQGVQVTRNPFDLPDGYWLVTFQPSGFTCGISPEGDVSS